MFQIEFTNQICNLYTDFLLHIYVRVTFHWFYWTVLITNEKCQMPNAKRSGVSTDLNCYFFIYPIKNMSVTGKVIVYIKTYF